MNNESRRVMLQAGNKLIFHCDDMGATCSITTRLLEAWNNCLIDGFSVFANTQFGDIIQKTLQSSPEKYARISVHLNLWEGKPLSPAEKVPLLVNKDGFFKIEFFNILRYYLFSSRKGKLVLLKEIETEWRAQIEKVKEIIKPRVLRAIDGHIHIHMPSFLFDLAARLAREYSIPEIRIVAEPFYISSKFSECFSKTFIINIVKRWVLAVFGHYNIRIAKKYGLKHPDAMIGVLYSGIISKANIKSGIMAAENRGKKRIEVLMHIGRAEESELSRWQGNHSKAGFVLNHNRDLEYADLVLLRKNNNG